MNMHELLADLYQSSRLMVLDFADIPDGTPPTENIQHFFETCESQDINPRLPEHRQAFNDQLLAHTGARYLVSRYGEDRKAMLVGSKIASEGRTLHMGIDIFCQNLETVFAPCHGSIMRIGREPENHSYGHYLIFRPDHLKGVYFFLGHLSKEPPRLGPVRAGMPIAQVGDFASNENGGWSRHLHLQIIRNLPAPNQTPEGYATSGNFAAASRAWPNPLPYFPEWYITN